MYLPHPPQKAVERVMVSSSLPMVMGSSLPEADQICQPRLFVLSKICYNLLLHPLGPFQLSIAPLLS